MYNEYTNTKKMLFKSISKEENGNPEIFLFTDGPSRCPKTAHLTLDLLYNLLEDRKSCFPFFFEATEDELDYIATYNPETTRDSRITKTLDKIEITEKNGALRLGPNQMTDEAAAKGAIPVIGISTDSVALAYAYLIHKRTAEHAAQAISTENCQSVRLKPEEATATNIAYTIIDRNCFTVTAQPRA